MHGPPAPRRRPDEKHRLLDKGGARHEPTALIEFQRTENKIRFLPTARFRAIFASGRYFCPSTDATRVSHARAGRRSARRCSLTLFRLYARAHEPGTPLPAKARARHARAALPVAFAHAARLSLRTASSTWVSASKADGFTLVSSSHARSAAATFSNNACFGKSNGNETWGIPHNDVALQQLATPVPGWQPLVHVEEAQRALFNGRPDLRLVVFSCDWLT